MHIYIDTSAIVKKYFWESGSADVISFWRKADSLATSSVAYAEMLSACYRKNRETPGQEDIFHAIIDAFRREWDSFIRVEINEELYQEIDRLMTLYPLRGFDAIHLASALLLHRTLSDDYLFLCFDQNLKNSANAEELQIFPV